MKYMLEEEEDRGKLANTLEIVKLLNEIDDDPHKKFRLLRKNLSLSM